MTTQQEKRALQERLHEVLGSNETATLWTMLSAREDLATKGDLSAVRDELKGDIRAVRDELKGDFADVRVEIADVRAGVGLLRTEIDFKYATRDDLLDLRRDFESSLQGFVRTFILAQVTTVVGVSGIVYGLTQLT